MSLGADSKSEHDHRYDGSWNRTPPRAFDVATPVIVKTLRR